MNIGSVCRRIQENDSTLKEVELERCNSQELETLLRTLCQRRSNLGSVIEHFELQDCELNVNLFMALLLHLCRRPQDQTTNHNSTLSSPLRSMKLRLYEDESYDIPADDIAFSLFRGIATDKPPGLGDLDSLALRVDGLSERSMAALQTVLQKQTTLLAELDLAYGKWVDDGAVAKSATV
jgi:hypothetical protein